MATKQRNFRLSAESVALLNKIAKERGITATDVVEYAVTNYAAELGTDIELAKAILTQQVAKAISSRKPKVQR